MRKCSVCGNTRMVESIRFRGKGPLRPSTARRWLVPGKRRRYVVRCHLCQADWKAAERARKLGVELPKSAQVSPLPASSHIHITREGQNLPPIEATSKEAKQ